MDVGLTGTDGAGGEHCTLVASWSLVVRSRSSRCKRRAGVIDNRNGRTYVWRANTCARRLKLLLL